MAQKICGVCGDDVAAKKRVKDTRGQYYCETCYANKRDAVVQAKQAAAPMAVAGVLDALPDLPPMEDIVPATVAPPPADDGMLELAPEVKPARQEVPMLGCATCKKLKPERQVKNLDGEFICSTCFAKRNTGKGATAASKNKASVKSKVKEADDGGEEGWADSLSGGLIISIGVVVAMFLVLFGLNVALPAKGMSGFLFAGVYSGVEIVFLLFRAGALIVSMLIAAQIMGGISFGFLGSVIYKSLMLLGAFTLMEFFIDRSESLMMLGVGFKGILFVLGFIVLFKIDFFEAMLLSFINFVIGWGLTMGMIIMLAIAARTFHVQGAPDDEEGPDPSRELDEKRSTPATLAPADLQRTEPAPAIEGN